MDLVQEIQNFCARIIYDNYHYINTRGIDLVKLLKLQTILERRYYFLGVLMSTTYIVWHPTTCTIMLLWSSIPMVLYKEFWKYGFIRTKMNKITLETQFLYKDFLDILKESSSLQWRHNEHNGVQNHLRLDCLICTWTNGRVKKTPKFRVTGLCEGNSPGTDEFPTQRASNEENVSIWWRYHVTWCIQKQISFHHWMTYTRLF